MAPFDRLGKIAAFDITIDAGPGSAQGRANSFDIYQSVIEVLGGMVLHGFSFHIICESHVGLIARNRRVVGYFLTVFTIIYQADRLFRY